MNEVAGGVYRLSNGVSNWYLARDGGKISVVDAGKPADWTLLLEALHRLGGTLEAIDCVLLTHAHSDHTGFAERARVEAGATPRVHQADAAVAAGAKPPDKHERGTAAYLVHLQAYRTLFGLMRGGGLRIVPVTEVVAFADGELLDVPGRPRVVHVPGHTAGSCALWFERPSVICTGDALVTLNPMTGRRGPQIMPGGLNVSSTQALESLTALESTGADLVLPGHGEALGGGVAEAVQAARRAGVS